MKEIQFNGYYTFDKAKHVISEKSDFKKDPPLAVQDHDMPIEQIIKRHTRSPESMVFEGIYSMKNDEDFANILPEFDKMDRIERLQYSKLLRQEIAEKRALLDQIGESKVDAEELQAAAVEVKKDRPDLAKED